MAGDGGKVTIKIKGDAEELKKSLDDVQKSLKTVSQEGQEGVEKLNQKFDESIKIQRRLNESTSDTRNSIAQVKDAVDNAGRSVEKAGQKAEAANSKNEKAIKVAKAGLADIKAGIDMAVAAAQKLSGIAWTGIEYNANIERLQTSFEVMTGSAEKAREIVDELRTMGAETPFETADLAETLQLLMQYGFAADDAMKSLEMLGDISQGSAEALTSIATGYAQMVSAGKVNLQDVKQMINVCHAA